MTMTPEAIDSAAKNFREYEARQLTIAYRQSDLDPDDMPFPTNGPEGWQSPDDISDAWLLDSLNQHPDELIYETCRVHPGAYSVGEIKHHLRERWTPGQRMTHNVEFFDNETNEVFATVTVYTALPGDGDTMDALQIAATAKQVLDNASARIREANGGREVAAFGPDEIQEWWA